MDYVIERKFQKKKGLDVLGILETQVSEWSKIASKVEGLRICQEYI